MASAILTLALPIAAQATTVSPVMVDLQSSGRRVVANVSVNNTGANSLPVEIVVTKLKANATGFEQTKDNAEDLLVVPPMALIAPGQTQTFRVQWIGDPDIAESNHYYVGINQVPVKLPEGKSAVQVVYNFQVLTSVSSPQRKPSLVVKSAMPAKTSEGKPAASVTIENSGAAHDYLSQHRIRITQTDANGQQVFEKTMNGSEFQQAIGYGLVASHSTRTVLIPMPLPSETGAVSAALLDPQPQ
ncbi:fimbria/pilus periplasmic chaperone [Novosphingobium sp. MW5]|nr:fimbria/pilus periplasmic chaperone [Novosphingobium sp. MW5]